MLSSESHLPDESAADTPDFMYSWSPEEILEGVQLEIIRFFHSRWYIHPIQLIPERSRVMVGERGDTFCLVCVQCDEQEYYIDCPYRPHGEVLEVDFENIDFLPPEFISICRERWILPY